MQTGRLRKYLGLSASVFMLTANSAWAGQVLEYTIRWSTADDRYHVYMRPTVSPTAGRDASMTAQVTMLAPHSDLLVDSFNVSNLTSSVSGTSWSQNSRVNKPSEAPGFDYISFTLQANDVTAFHWTAGKEIEVFNFGNTGACLGVVKLMDDNDPFNVPNNSADTNPGNQFTNLGWSDYFGENNYLRNYGPTADCSLSLDSDNDGLKNGDEIAIGTNPYNQDSDGDGIPDGVEVGSLANPVNTDGDSLINALDADDDGDGKLTKNEDANGDGDNNPATQPTDSDGDGKPNYLDVNDTDGPLADPDKDGLTNAQEATLGTNPNDADSDHDGIPDKVEVGTNLASPLNTDGDSKINALDADDDNDGIPTASEDKNTDGDNNPATNPLNTDGDSKPNYLDSDDDGDGLLTSAENYNGGTPGDDDTDKDNIPDYLDADDDGDGTASGLEGNDPNKNGLPDDALDNDGDGKPDYLDANNTDGPLGDPDKDGLTNAQEATLGTNPNDADSDHDGIPDNVEVGTNLASPLNTDGDSKINALDADDDNDGIPTASEDKNTDGDNNPATNPLNTDGDSKPNYLDSDDDGDGLLTSTENYNGGTPGDDDTDKDNIPDYLDADDDGDGTASALEGNDPNKNGLPDDAIDTDADTIPDYLDATVDSVALQLKVMLQGAYNASTGMMRDDLRSKGMLPVAQPYATTYGYTGSEQTSLQVLGNTGNDAVVDWLLVELRSGADSKTILRRQAVLVQRDGDTMDAATGSTSLRFIGIVPGNYYVSVRHRNHLGVMTANAVQVKATPSLLDFTQGTTQTYGQYAQTAVNGVQMLWTGDANADSKLIANGAGQDAGVIFAQILSASGNSSFSSNYVVTGYYPTDFSMDGKTIFTGPGNDSNLLIANVLGHPGNPLFNANFIVRGQLP